MKANIWFTTLFGGGCIFPSGEDSMWLTDAKKAGLTFYVSKETIGTIDMGESSWFTGYDKKFYFAKGAYYQATHPKMFALWMMYFLLRTRSFGILRNSEKRKWMHLGREGYKQMRPFADFQNQ